MNKYVKVAIVIVLVVLAGIALRYIPQITGSKQDTSTKDVSAVIDELLRFEIVDEDIDDERADTFFERFKKYRDVLQGVSSREDLKNGTLLRALTELSLLHRDIGALEKAKDGLLLAYSIDQGNFIINGNLGELYFRYLDDPESAIEYYMAAVSPDASVKNPIVETHYRELFDIYYFHLDNPDKAEEVLIQGVEQYPDALEILTELAQFYEKVGRREDAITRYQELLKKNPDSIVARESLKRLGS